MKATELMIGDWIYDNYHKAYGRVNTLTRALLWVGEEDDDWQLNYDEIEPIPITAEILERNGFEEEHGYNEVVYMDYGDDNYSICIHLKERNYTNGAYTFANIDSGYICIEELPINYVHELQHTLRLCSIDKEIEL